MVENDNMRAETSTEHTLKLQIQVTILLVKMSYIAVLTIASSVQVNQYKQYQDTDACVCPSVTCQKAFLEKKHFHSSLHPPSYFCNCASSKICSMLHQHLQTYHFYSRSPKF